MKYFVGWELHSKCNYRCPYCCGEAFCTDGFGDMGKRSRQEEALDFFSSLGSCEFDLTGGEPTITPSFVEFCRSIVDRGFSISCLGTNLSRDITDFAEQIPPERVTIVFAALHPQGEQDFEGFKHRVQVLKQNGHRVLVRYCVVPGRQGKVPQYFETFQAMDVPFDLRAVSGNYLGKVYPDSYTGEDVSLFKKWAIDPLAIFHAEKRNFKSRKLPCDFGYRKLQVDASGRVFLCRTANAVIGNIWQKAVTLAGKPVPCPASFCSCPVLFFPMNTLKEYRERYRRGYDLENCGTFLPDGPVAPVTKDEYNHFLQIVAGAESKVEEPRNMAVREVERLRDKVGLWRREGKRIAIYGVGGHSDALIKVVDLSGVKALCFVDSNPDRCTGSFHGYPLLSPESALSIGIDAVLISSKHFEHKIYDRIRPLEERGIEIFRLYSQNGAWDLKDYADQMGRA